MEQWAAQGDDDLLVWQKHPDNPVLRRTLHSDVVDIGSWRDPFTFKHDGRTYILTGGYVGRERGPGTSHGHVSLYRAEHAELTRWTYLGPIFVHPVSPDCACPNLFPIQDRWALILSRHDPHVVDYFVGTWDTETFEFRPETCAPFEYGEGVYATQGLYDARGRLIVWGTIHSYRTTGRIDWPGCLTLPRIVSLRPDGLLSFEPLPELQSLRRRHQSIPSLRLASSSQLLPGVRGGVLEIKVEFVPGDAAAFGLQVRCSRDGSRAITIRYDDSGLEVDGERGVFNDQEKALGPFTLKEDEQALQLDVFLDKGVLEVYANNRACYSHPISPRAQDLGVQVFAQDGSVTMKSFEAWEMAPIR
jgi:beta-fructofuranosidase